MKEATIAGTSAKMIEDSVSDQGIRLSTFQLRYPRIIHSEFMTHRVFSRNASSSRATPVWRMIKEVLADPAMPFEWGSNQRGMQAGKNLRGIRLAIVKWCWLTARYPAVFFALLMIWCGVHKQIANRILEPWAFISVIVTATEWNNFFALRVHEDADPTIRNLAAIMQTIYRSHKPTARKEHLPYLQEAERFHVNRFEISSARCARVSFLNHDGTKPTVDQDLKLYQRLMGGLIKHASPTEHQASQADGWTVSNLRGWSQYRKTIPGENIA